MKKKQANKKKNFGKVLNRIRKRNNEMTKKAEADKSRIPQCMNAINEIVSKIDRHQAGCFAGGAEYLNAELDNAKAILMNVFRNLSLRLAPVEVEAVAAKITAAAEYVQDENVKKELLAIAEDTLTLSADMLTPQLIKENMNSFKLIFDESNIEANEDEIVFRASAEFEIKINGKVKRITIDGRFPVPPTLLVLE